MMENNEVLVEVKKVSKKFSKDLKKSLWYGLLDIGNSLLGRTVSSASLREDEFWAVKDINFTLRRGECLGLIGHNGAGKSTLLKMLNGLIKPDQGTIKMYGKVSALIELGAGFNPLLTGRENIYINGQLLGFSKKEIDSKLKAILDFAEIGDFIETPVQNYSSGMKVRLGFAIAAQMEPDVLIIDEVLAVGDLGFVLKCFNVIDNILPNTAVIFVSHNMPQVSRICSSIFLIEKGREIYLGNDVSKGIDTYYKRFSNKYNINHVVYSSGDSELLDAEFLPAIIGEDEIYTLNRLDDLVISIRFKVKSEIIRPFLNIGIYDKEQRPVAVCQDEAGLSEKNIFYRDDRYNHYLVTVTIARINLSKGNYSVSLLISSNFRKNPILRLHSILEFRIKSPNDNWTSIEFEGTWK